MEQNLPQTALSLIVSGKSQGQTSEEVMVTQKSVARQPSGSYLKEVKYLLKLGHPDLLIAV